MVAVDVWCAPLDVEQARWIELEQTLDVAERARARQIRDPLQRWRWVADHGWRRTLLGRLLERSPQQVAFSIGERGRPDVTATSLSFNASRGGAIAVYATSWDAVVGVDVEPLRPGVELEAFARRFFTNHERAALAALAPEDQEAACFACWTRKEAYVKAVGTGLVFPLTEAEVWSGDDRTVRYGDCEIRTLTLDEGLSAALAVVGGPADGQCQIEVKLLENL